jgi:hypothetical protein
VNVHFVGGPWDGLKIEVSPPPPVWCFPPGTEAFTSEGAGADLMAELAGAGKGMVGAEQYRLDDRRYIHEGKVAPASECAAETEAESR